MWAVALRTLGDPEEAADAVQDASLSAFRSAATFRGEAKVTTWLHRIVVNACLDRARRQAVRPTVPLPEQPPPDPRDRLAERETGIAVQQALAQLPPEQRSAIVLVDLMGMAVEEAAAVLQVPPGTVKSRCSRGRARLAVTLGHLRNPDGSESVPPTTDRIVGPETRGGA
jgi:RNA polymerase sigma-70 factor (ECF subfamily)